MADKPKVQYVARNKKGELECVYQIGALGEYTRAGKYPEPLQSYLTDWLEKGFSVTRETCNK